MTEPPARRTLPTLGALRGIASLAVCWFHMTDSAPAGWVRSSGSHGWMGVEMFFVISGFIIPYSMLVGGYRIGDLGRFMAKRLVRLEPPYLASLVLTLALGWAATLSPMYRGEAFHPGLVQVLLHVGYLNVFARYPWLNLVYWTLAVELQFYLTVALVFPFIASTRLRVWGATFAVLATVGWLLPDLRFLPVYLPLFVLGMAAFKRRVRQIDDRVLALLCLVVGAIVFARWGTLVTAIVLCTTLVLAYVDASFPRLSALGAISYSLYLVHVPIGGRVVNLLGRVVHSEGGRAGAAALGTLASIVSAWVLYVLVERPAQRWSSRIRFRSAAGDRGAGTPRAS